MKSVIWLIDWKTFCTSKSFLNHFVLGLLITCDKKKDLVSSENRVFSLNTEMSIISCYTETTGWSKSLCVPDDYNHQVHTDFLITLYIGSPAMKTPCVIQIVNVDSMRGFCFKMDNVLVYETKVIINHYCLNPFLRQFRNKVKSALPISLKFCKISSSI